MVITPARAHAASNHPGEPTKRDDSAEVMKIPEPIIEPTTIIVASSKVKPRTSLAADSVIGLLIYVGNAVLYYSEITAKSRRFALSTL
jgi:hypothetical protein